MKNMDSNSAGDPKDTQTFKIKQYTAGTFCFLDNFEKI